MNLPYPIHKSWEQHLKSYFKSKEMQTLNRYLGSRSDYLPAPENIFRVFSMPLDEIKVVILGADPYPDKNHATGLAFAIPRGCGKFSSSLIAIDKELQDEGFDGIIDTELINWVNQGVFLLNTALTVQNKNSSSHLKIWRYFTIRVIKIISFWNPCIWLLWGSKAKEFEQYIWQDRDKVNHVLRAAHPQYEMRGGGGFYGCNHFNEVNKLLKEPIKW